MSALSPHALARWPWMPGMVSVNRHGQHFRLDAKMRPTPQPDTQPDLDDPVTRACLPMAVRAAWNAPEAYCRPCRHITATPAPERWVAFIADGVTFAAATETGAWIAALEAAP